MIMDAKAQIDKQISEFSDWRGELYSKLRKIVHEASSEIQEDFKWGTGVFTHNGNVLAIGVFKDHVTMNFFKGATLADPNKLFNAGLEAKKSRAIEWFENDTVNEEPLKELILSAVKQNM